MLLGGHYHEITKLSKSMAKNAINFPPDFQAWKKPPLAASQNVWRPCNPYIQPQYLAAVQDTVFHNSTGTQRWRLDRVVVLEGHRNSHKGAVFSFFFSWGIQYKTNVRLDKIWTNRQNISTNEQPLLYTAGYSKYQSSSFIFSLFFLLTFCARAAAILLIDSALAVALVTMACASPGTQIQFTKMHKKQQ